MLVTGRVQFSSEKLSNLQMCPKKAQNTPVSHHAVRRQFLSVAVR